MRSARLSRPALALLFFAGACAGRGPSDAPAPRAPKGQDAGPPFESPARWAAYPSRAGEPLASLDLGGARCVVLTNDGQRWLVTGRDAAKPCVGPGVASGSAAPEALVFVQRAGAGFRFVGEGGSVYTSRDPIGPLERIARPPVAMSRVAAGSSTVVGADATGRTYYFDGAWKPSSVASKSAPVDVGVDAAGRALWIGVPEVVLVSTDAGKTFAPPEGGQPPRIAAWQVARDGDRLIVEGAIGALAWDGVRLVPKPGRPRDAASPRAAIEPQQGPQESLVREGRAAVDGRRYLEIVDDPIEGSRYALVVAELGGERRRQRLSGHQDCQSMKIGAAGQMVALSCIRTDDDEPDLPVAIDLSTDGGRTFTALAELRAQTLTDVRIAVAPDGSVLTTGTCAPDRPATGDAKAGPPPPCSPRAPVLVRREGSEVRVVDGSAGQLENGTARSPALSADGRAAYFLGKTKRDSRTVVFVSRDGGRSYAARPIDLAISGWLDEEEADFSIPGNDLTLGIPEHARITIDETGTLGVVCEGHGGTFYVTLDPDGRVRSSGRPPDAPDKMGGFGSRALAVGYSAEDVLRAWESLDGGASWSEIAATPSVREFADLGDAAIACSQGGCVLGDELVRVGWEGQAEPPMEVDGDPGLFDLPDGTLSAPISCQLVPKTDWTRIADKGTDGSFGPQLPRLRELARGKTAWSVVTVGEDNGKIDVVSAGIPDKGAPHGPLQTRSLLGAIQDKSGRTATTVRPQAEGFAALRARFPIDKSGKLDTSKPLEGIEVAWQNQYAGVVARKTVRLDGTWRTSFAVGDSLRPSLFTIVSGGIVVRADATDRATYVDAQAAPIQFDYPNWLDLLVDKRGLSVGDAAHVGGHPLAVAFLDRSPSAQAFATARRSGPEWRIAATTVAPAHADMDWFQAGDRSGVAAVTVDGTRQERAVGRLLEADGTLGEPFDLPRLADLGDRITPCSAEQRKSSARTVSRHVTAGGAVVGSGRRAVLVTDSQSAGLTGGATDLGLDPSWLLTDGAVLHGTPKEPCVAALRASGIRQGIVAVIAGDLEHAWLLRESRAAPAAKSAGKSAPKGGPASARRPPPAPQRVVLVRPMSCKIQPDLAIPAEASNRATHRLPDDFP